VAWLERVKHALRTLVWRYNSDRMVRDYARLAYSRAAATTTSELRL
jgi:glucan phosphorylase